METSSSAKCPSCKQTRKRDSFFFESFATFIVVVGVSSSCCQVEEEQCWFFQKTAHPCVVEFTPTNVLLLLILKDAELGESEEQQMADLTVAAGNLTFADKTRS